MALHLLKMAVGVETVEHLAERQQQRLRSARADGESPMLRHLTRNAPRRADEVLAGGSIYWIIRGAIRARQGIVGFDRAVDGKGRRRCALILDPRIVATEARPHRAMRGWRYLMAEEAPADRPQGPSDEEALPPHLAAELRELGLL